MHCLENQQWHWMNPERLRWSSLPSYLTEVRVKAMTMQYGGSAVQWITFQMDKRGPEARWLCLSRVRQTPMPLKPRFGCEAKCTHNTHTQGSSHSQVRLQTDHSLAASNVALLCWTLVQKQCNWSLVIHLGEASLPFAAFLRMKIK